MTAFATFLALWLSLNAIMASVVMVLHFLYHRGYANSPSKTRPVTFLKAIEGHDSDLENNLKSFLPVDELESFQLILCVPNPDDPAYNLCKSFKDRYPSYDITVAHSAHLSTHKNRKVRHLVAGVEYAKYPTLVFSDADTRLEPGCLSALLGTLDQEGVALAYAGSCYRPGGTLANGALSTLLGGGFQSFAALNALTRFTGGPEPMVGSFWAIRHDTLNVMGGLSIAANHIGDDLRLAETAYEMGLKVQQSPVPIRCYEPDLTMKGLIGRLERWIRVIRAHQPIKTIGYPVFMACFPLAFALGLVVAALGQSWLLIPLAITLLLRTLMALTLVSYSNLPLRTALPHYLLLAESILFYAYLRAHWGQQLTWRAFNYSLGDGGCIVSTERR